MLDAKEYLESIKHFVDYNGDALEILQNDPIYLPLLKVSVEGYKEILKTETPSLELMFRKHNDLVTPHKYVLHLSKKDKSLREHLNSVNDDLLLYKRLEVSGFEEYLDFVNFEMYFSHDICTSSKYRYSDKVVEFPIQLSLYFTPEDLYEILIHKKWQYNENVDSDSHVFSLNEKTISFPKVLETDEDCSKLKDTLAYLQSTYSTEFIQSYNFTNCDHMHYIFNILLNNFDIKKWNEENKESYE